MKMKIEPLISISEMCALVNRNRRTIWTWVKNGDFPEPVRHKKRTLGWRASDVKNWLADN